MRDKQKVNQDQAVGNTTKTESNNSGRRRRIPRDPNVMQGYPKREEQVPLITDQYQKLADGITADPDQAKRNNAPQHPNDDDKSTKSTEYVLSYSR